MAKKTVFLTGASGNMGFHSFMEFLKHRDKFNIVVLLRGSEKNKLKFKPYENDPCVKIVWGDLTKYEDVLSCVSSGVDYVLHVGGMVSPAADYFPTKTVVTNTTAARNIVNAIKAQPVISDQLRPWIYFIPFIGHIPIPMLRLRALWNRTSLQRWILSM